MDQEIAWDDEVSGPISTPELSTSSTTAANTTASATDIALATTSALAALSIAASSPPAADNASTSNPATAPALPALSASAPPSPQPFQKHVFASTPLDDTNAEQAEQRSDHASTHVEHLNTETQEVHGCTAAIDSDRSTVCVSDSDVAQTTIAATADVAAPSQDTQAVGHTSSDWSIVSSPSPNTPDETPSLAEGMPCSCSLRLRVVMNLSILRFP